MTFAKRTISVRFILDASQGTFEESGTNAVDLTGLRCSVSLTNTSGAAMNQLDLTLYGMDQKLINKLTVLQNGLVQGIYNQVEVTAGQGSDMALIFAGHVLTAWGDYSGAPEVSFVVQAYGAAASAYASPPPISYKGSVSAATVATGIAASMVPPLTLENDGVNVQLSDVYLPGDPMTQLRQLAAAAHFNWTTDTVGVLAIWPRGFARTAAGGDALGPAVNADTGLIGYPSFNDKGVMFSTFFNPALRIGGPLLLTSLITPACGQWYPYNIGHELESETPDGHWFTHVEAQRLIDEGPQV